MIPQENVLAGWSVRCSFYCILLDSAWKWINIENSGVSRLLQGLLRDFTSIQCIVNLQEGYSMSLCRLTGPLSFWFAEHASGYWPPGKELFPGTLNIKPSPNYHLCMCSKLLQSCPTLCDPMDCSCQAPLSTGFSRQDTGVGCHGLLQGTLPNPGIDPVSLASPALQADCLLVSYWESPSIITQDWYS